MLTVSPESIACHLFVLYITFPTNASPLALQSIILSLPVPPATPPVVGWNVCGLHSFRTALSCFEFEPYFTKLVSVRQMS